MPGPTLVSYGGQGANHWGQMRCPRCGAWLRDMPDRSEPYNSTRTVPDPDCPACRGSGWIREPDDWGYGGEPCDGKTVQRQERIYRYFWRCLACGHEREQVDSTPPEDWSPDPNAELKAPGTFPPAPVRDPQEWKNAAELSDAEQGLVRECWRMLDSLKGESLIHRVNYIWQLEEDLLKQDIDAVTRVSREYVEMLDYEAIHGQRMFSFFGTEGDVRSIRRYLAQIPDSPLLMIRGNVGEVVELFRSYESGSLGFDRLVDTLRGRSYIRWSDWDRPAVEARLLDKYIRVGLEEGSWEQAWKAMPKGVMHWDDYKSLVYCVLKYHADANGSSFG